MIFFILKNQYFRCFGLGFGYFWGRIRILREKSSSFMGSIQYFAKIQKKYPPGVHIFKFLKIEKSTYSAISSYK